MKTNLGVTDSAIRAILGAVLILVTALGWIGPWGWLGIVPMLTAALRFCPLYALLGIQSCPVEKTEELHFHADLPVSFHHDGKT